jgi:hypothetical protein
MQFRWIVWVVALTACTVKSTGLPIGSTFNSATKPATSIVVSPTITLASVPTPAEIVVTQPALRKMKWATYVFDAGVSFQYPADGIVVSSQEDSVEFLETPYLPYNVKVNVYHRPAKDKAVTDPHSWGANEGGYKILWEKPIAIEGADGLEFIWGIPADKKIGGVLYAIYYSKQRELEVRLRTDADIVPDKSNKFGVFEYMVQSVQIAP